MVSGYANYNFQDYFKYFVKKKIKITHTNSLYNLLSYFKTFSGYNLYLETNQIKDGDDKDPIIIL